jgi:Zn-dependent protease with chaperone function
MAALPTARAMDFFAHQDRARRRSSWLLINFLLAVFLITLAVYVVTVLAFFGFDIKAENELAFNPWTFEFYLWVAAITLTIIATGTLYKILVLSKGGEVVARTLGARPVEPNATDFKERQLLNVVEEMAIASGVPVPSVYLLDKEKGINAFAAGFTPGDAVVAVTRGTLELLSRDELQGVIAHEFSHILNGDMRLNIRLMGALHGILVIALIGYSILRGTRFSSREKGGGLVVLLFGVALVAIGFVGVFFAKIIKSAVSRQREFLADASAVQFTRNPGGIAGALKKIGGLVYGSGISHPKAEEASHFYFANGLERGGPRARRYPQAQRSFDFMATHPPLGERIKRIDPNFDGRFPEVSYPSKEVSTQPLEEKPRFADEAVISVVPREWTEQVGKLTKAHLAYAAALIGALPTSLTDKLHDPSGARAVVFALLLSQDSTIRQTQFRLINECDDPLASRETLEVSSLAERCPPRARIPLIDMALPALRRLAPRQHKQFRDVVDRLVMADQKCDLFEYSVLHILRRHLDRYFIRPSPPDIQYWSLAPLSAECSVLLSGLAHTGHENEETAGQAFEKAREELQESKTNLSYMPRAECELTAITQALDKLAAASPKLKRQVLRASAAAVSHDNKVTVPEGELLRAIADALDCPMPPLLPGQDLSRQ